MGRWGWGVEGGSGVGVGLRGGGVRVDVIEELIFFGKIQKKIGVQGGGGRVGGGGGGGGGSGWM